MNIYIAPYVFFSDLVSTRSGGSLHPDQLENGDCNFLNKVKKTCPIHCVHGHVVKVIILVLKREPLEQLISSQNDIHFCSSASVG